MIPLLISPLGAGFFHSFVGFVDVLDIPLEHEEIWRAFAVHLQSATIIPFDRAFDLFAVQQDNHHRCMRVDLFLVVKDLRVGFVGRWDSLLNLDRCMCMLLSGALLIIV